MARGMGRRSTVMVGVCVVVTAAAVASAAGAPGVDVDAYRAHDKRTAEGMQASRAPAPAPSASVADASVVQQMPIDTSFPVPLSKRASTPPLAGSPVPAAPPACPYTSGVKTASLVKVFPELTWHVCVRDMGLKGLWVGPVQLRRTPTGPWTWVLFQAGLAEIFVPYDSGTFRPYDLAFCPANGCALDQVTDQDKGLNGVLVTLTNETRPTVVTEARDRGVASLCKQTTSVTRRGEELLVWGVSDAGNYDNIMQYGFRDDGTMTFRAGHTGYNNPQKPTEAHTHESLWRVDMDLNGAGNDTASLLEHNEPGTLQATEVKSAFHGGTEGGAAWDPARFTSALIEDSTTNRFGDKWGYEFTPAQLAAGRHFGPDDDWTKNDVWVTDYHSDELGWTTAPQRPDDYLLAEVANNEAVTNRDLVTWVKTTAHHDPTDEDRSVNDASNPANVTGITLVHWSGFDVQPHDLFDANPMGGPVRCGT